MTDMHGRGLCPPSFALSFFFLFSFSLSFQLNYYLMKKRKIPLSVYFDVALRHRFLFMLIGWLWSVYNQDQFLFKTVCMLYKNPDSGSYIIALKFPVP